jgi:hypothetical protein
MMHKYVYYLATEQVISTHLSYDVKTNAAPRITAFPLNINPMTNNRRNNQ